MKTWTIFNDFDGNDTFTVEAASVEEAAFVTLNFLGWVVAAQPDENEE